MSQVVAHNLVSVQPYALVMTGRFMGGTYKETDGANAEDTLLNQLHQAWDKIKDVFSNKYHLMGLIAGIIALAALVSLQVILRRKNSKKGGGGGGGGGQDGGFVTDNPHRGGGGWQSPQQQQYRQQQQSPNFYAASVDGTDRMQRYL